MHVSKKYKVEWKSKMEVPMNSTSNSYLKIVNKYSPGATVPSSTFYHCCLLNMIEKLCARSQIHILSGCHTCTDKTFEHFCMVSKIFG